MKTLLAAFILCLCWQANAPAELSLSNGTDPALANPALRELSTASLPLSGGPDLTVPAATWMGAGTTPALTLNPLKTAPAIAQLDLSLPTSAGAGVPDSWVYAALGLILLGLGWACSGSLSRQKSAPLPLGGEGRSARIRTQRVHMLPLDVGR